MTDDIRGRRPTAAEAIAAAVTDPERYAGRDYQDLPNWVGRAACAALAAHGYLIVTRTSVAAQGRLDAAIAQGEAVAGMPAEGPYPATIEEVAQEIAVVITKLAAEINSPDLVGEVARRLRAQ